MGKRPLIRKVVVRPVNTGQRTRRVSRNFRLTKYDFAMLAVALGFYDANECEQYAELQDRKALERSITGRPAVPRGSRPAS